MSDIYGTSTNGDIYGGAGNDKLTIDGVKTATGGAGADIFAFEIQSPFSTAAKDWSGFATITDFKVSEGDRLQLSFFQKYPNDLVFRGMVGADFTLDNGKVFSSDAYGPGFVEAWTWSTGGDLYFIVDTDGGGRLSSMDYVLKFAGVTNLSLGDFTAASIDAYRGFTANLGGSSSADIFAGTIASDTYYGLGGDDQLHGGDGVDHLYGGAGADQIWGDNGDDDLQGNLGDDTIYGGDGADIIAGGGGNNTIHGGAGNDEISIGGNGGDMDAADAANIAYGDDGDDALVGGFSRRDQLHGGDGRDRVFGAGELWGDAGDDTLSAGGKAIMHGGDGDDQLTAQNGFAIATMYGDGGKDTFAGGPNDDVMYVELGDRSAFGSSGKDVFYIADVRAGEIALLTTIYGDADQDIFVITGALSAELTLQGSSSSGGDYEDDMLELGAAAGVTRVDLGLATAQDVGMGRLILLGIDSVHAGDHGSVLTGDANANRLIGGLVGDTLSGGGGADVLTGNGGDDVLDGGDGRDVAAYSGASTDYSWTRGTDGTWSVKDLRANASDGSDTLRSIETLKFSDKSVSIGYNLPTILATAFSTILRAPVGGDAQFAFGADLANKIAFGLSTSSAILSIAKTAGATTSVATLAYEFFTGKIPGQPGVDYLVSPTGPNANNLNSAYYQSFNLENRYINFAVNLGKLGEGREAFTAKYELKSLFDATREVYKTIFGAAPTDAKIHTLIDTRIDYFASYGGDGVNGIGTKAALVGWLLAEAVKADVGVMAKSNDAWLTDLADGSAPFAIDLLDPAKGYYKADFVFGG